MANIILVHGAFTDALCWAGVIPILTACGHRVVAVQSPATSLDDDVAAVKRAKAEFGNAPTVLVGHCYGGTVISAAASGDRDVIALVFVAGLTNRKGESVKDLLGTFPATEGMQALRTDSEGWAILDRDVFPELFASDLSIEQAQILASSQPRLGPACFETELKVEPAWKTVRSWYLICEQDRTVDPKLQLSLATRIGAHIVSIQASHVAMLSQPEVVADAINQAAIRKAFVTG
jgi:pimeloyl-ACP methyl ester carboxylesterase